MFVLSWHLWKARETAQAPEHEHATQLQPSALRLYCTTGGHVEATNCTLSLWHPLKEIALFNIRGSSVTPASVLACTFLSVQQGRHESCSEEAATMIAIEWQVRPILR